LILGSSEKLRLQRIAKYGPGSEKLTSLQLELLELEPGVSNVEVAAEGEREALPATPDKQKRKRHPGRQTLPADLPRVERVIACTSEQCACGGCGQATTLIGYDESEQLDVEPAKYFVLVTKREKRACKSCEERGVMAAPLPDRILEKSLVSNQVIVDAIVSKYSNHCPLYLLSEAEGNMTQDANRKLCVDPARSETLCMSGSFLHRSWEISSVPGPQGTGGKGKAESRNPVVYADEKSDTPIRAEKPPNKGMLRRLTTRPARIV
jgi:transposase